MQYGILLHFQLAKRGGTDDDKNGGEMVSICHRKEGRNCATITIVS